MEETADETIKFVRGLYNLMMKHKHQIRTNRPSIYSQELINNVFRHPYTKIEFVVKEVGISRPTAMSYLNQLIEEGILEKFKIGRENYYVNPELFNFILNAFHTDKDTKTDIINSNMVDD